jgi:mono/diheme cytochrome c family protein
MSNARFLSIILWAIVVSTAQTPQGPNPSETAKAFQNSVQPFFAKACFSCHNARLKTGGLNLEAYTTPDSVVENREKFEMVLQKLQSGEMPPKGLPRPTAADLKSVESWIRGAFDRADDSSGPPSGRVTVRRLNRAEYNNTIRDLLGVDSHPADDFPQDDSGYGFDNIGDVLSLSPILMEKYLASAEKITRTAIFGAEKLAPTVVRHQPPYREGTDGGNNSRFLDRIPWTVTNYDMTGLTLPSAVHMIHTFPAEGDYEFRIDPEGNRPRPSEPFKVAVWMDGKQLTSVEFEATTNSTGMEGLDQTAIAHVPAGTHWVAASVLREYEGLPAKYGGLNPTKQPDLPTLQFGRGGFQLPADATPEQKAAFEARQKAIAAGKGGGRAAKGPQITDVSFRINFVEIAGPFKPNTAPSPESLKKIFVCKEQTAPCERRIVTELARRAYRRPATPQEVSSLLTLATNDRKRGASFEQSIGVAIEAMLVSPNFLFRIEGDPKTGPERQNSQFELASRLSYFLWSSMPDDELLLCAERKTLGNPEVLESQVRRMLKDSKVSALVENFGGQWLRFRALESVQPDPVAFMAFDDYLRLSMQRETEMFLQNLLSTDGSVLDILNGKYSFLNEELARFYGIGGVVGPEFRKVDLTGTPRGGVLTQGSVLTTSSYATRTSVVLRGKWVLENLLNAPVPPAPPGVPPFDENKAGTTMSQRQQMEEHRANPVCASCHSRMDPIGFGLENFDAIGRWRMNDGRFPIDASGTLPNGKHFNGPGELEGVLLENREAFAQCIAEKLLIYALGRGIEPYDRPSVKTIAAQVAKDNYRISSLILGIVKSPEFQN